MQDTEVTALDPRQVARRDGQGMEQGRTADTEKQAQKCPRARGSFPEHAQEERREERGVHEAEHELNDIHRVVIHGREVCRRNA